MAMSGQLGGHVDDEVARPEGGHPVEDGVRLLAQRLLEAADHPGREPGVHQLAVAGVLGRVGAHHLQAGPVGSGGWSVRAMPPAPLRPGPVWWL